MPTVELVPVETAADRRRVEALLAANDLPTADVGAGTAEFFLARDGDRHVGCGGLDRHGSVGLLRSVAIAESHRGAGFGTAVCRALERRADEAGIDALYLLTTSAAGFFDRLGFERVDRTDVPEAIRTTREFAELCPASATAMRRSLA